MRVLVTGGRDFRNRAWMFDVLDTLHEASPITTLIHGGAAGADTLADIWARLRHVLSFTYKAEWDKYGRQAGVIRNQKMFDEGKPDILLVFPGGRGTGHMHYWAQLRVGQGIQCKIINVKNYDLGQTNT